MAAAAAGLAAAWWLLPPDAWPASHPPGARIRVEAGSGAAVVGASLAQQGWVRSAAAFVVWSRLTGSDRQLQAGYYRAAGRLNLVELVRLLTSGRPLEETVTIPEGSTIRTIAALLAQRGLVDPDRFVRLALDDRWLGGELARRLGKPPGSLEGYLFPDTYRFSPGQGEEQILRRMVARFVERVLPIYRELGEGSGLSLHEAVILASIVEKEAMVDPERPLIASVFRNRLRLGRPLQADPTVLYALGDGPRRLTREDLAVDSPYNTYRYPGLPPTPIASPGEASLRAVLAPASTPYLYFVARGDGTHIFSRTFREHRQARQQAGY